MASVLTCVARVRDWHALRELHRQALLDQAREAGATRFRVFRNVRDASLALLVAEGPESEALEELARALGARLQALPGAQPADDRLWEAADWETLG